jgi:hypothetical protein
MAISLAMLTMTVCTFAQSDTITQNPNAKPFNRIWSIAGRDGNKVGDAITGLPDINGDGINEFAVASWTDEPWRIFFGAPIGSISHTPSQVLKSVGGIGGRPLPVGNFWGDGNRTIAFATGVDPKYIFLRIDTARKMIDTIPVAILDPTKMNPVVHLSSLVDAIASDLDGDGADEFIITQGGMLRDGKPPRRGEIWIYRGGPNFQVDTPTVIIRARDSLSGFNALYIGRWDADDKLDMAAMIGYRGDSSKVGFWFSDDGSPWNWTTPSRYFVPTTSEYGTTVLDCDGDGRLDIAMANGIARVNLFRSGSGKDIRTRSFAPDDADGVYRLYDFSVPRNLGYMSDSAGRYEMLGIGGAGTDNRTMLLGLSGGPNGPDHTYDAYVYGGPYNITIPVDDVTGDGWNDAMEAYAAYGFNAGIAVLYAGGPYIPRDPSLSVEYANPVAGVRRDAVSVWPIPAREELHIAWRGDLSRMPTRFAVHDVLGHLIARGEVESWRGEALWRCEDVPSGAYFLTIYDTQGALIATSQLLKE